MSNHFNRYQSEFYQFSNQILLFFIRILLGFVSNKGMMLDDAALPWLLLAPGQHSSADHRSLPHDQNWSKGYFIINFPGKVFDAVAVQTDGFNAIGSSTGSNSSYSIIIMLQTNQSTSLPQHVHSTMSLFLLYVW